MIDLHSHLIPGVDDGSSSRDMSISMLKGAREDGITTIAATPHIFSSLGKISSVEEMGKLIEEFIDSLEEECLSIEVVGGTENHFDSELKDNLHRYSNILTLNRSRYFLLEFPLDFVFPGSQNYIKSIMSEGFIPIICHPERNSVFRSDPALLYDFVQQGCLCQLNAGSLSGDFGHDCMSSAYEFLKYNLIHLIASDSHDLIYRKPNLSFLYKLDPGIKHEKLDLFLKDIPRAILNNENIPQTEEIRNPRKKLFFFNIFGKKE